ncbi:MAG: maltose alpha-D-glucosyltransferase [Dehalococcoidia bacterium]
MVVSATQPAPVDSRPRWYEDAIMYEVHVRAFFDSNGDGIGDFRGFAQKLDYLQGLGVTAIWLLPFYPSPLKDDGYDIADYAAVHPSYGSLRDVKYFIREAHRRGLRVITELVCNHTSDQHPWFQRARRAKPGSAARNFYVWSDSQERYKDARIIFKDFETSNWTYDPLADAYYWHRFYHHQPDLNFESAQVRRAIKQALDFWLEIGIDGLRLDAVPYLYEREGTNCENLPETHAFLKDLRRHVDARFEDRMLLAEANQWPEDAVAYFGDGDECHMAFHFPLMPRMFMAIRMEDRFPIVDILAQTPSLPPSAQWALFLRNHDELTLEMVTDEERDYMYRVYANDPQMRINLGIRRRLAPLLGNNRRRIELMNGLLFSLPGTPVIYYGDEIGMGDNSYLGDRNGVRTPMQWSADRNAGFSPANPQKLYLPPIIDPEYHYQTINVEAQENNPNSLLWWMKRLIALRKRYQAFSRGSIEFLHPENRKVLVFTRRYEDQVILVVANLSRFVQAVELDLSAYERMVPVELFGQTRFPRIGELPYFLTLGPHSFYWFSLEPQRVEVGPISTTVLPEVLPAVTVVNGWEDLLTGAGRTALSRILPDYLEPRRWFGGKARRLRSAQIRDAVPVRYPSGVSYITFVDVEYLEGDAEAYVLPLTFAPGEKGDQVRYHVPHAIVARLEFENGKEPGLLHDAMADRDFARALLDVIAGRRRVKGGGGDLRPSTTRWLRRVYTRGDEAPEPSIIKAEQSNTSIVFGDRLILKLYRRPDHGLNPDVEIGKFLTEIGFPNVPPLAGAVEYQENGRDRRTILSLQGYIPNEGDAWQYTVDAFGQFFERVITERAGAPESAVSTRALLALSEHPIPASIHEEIGDYLEAARLLGQRTAELHAALAAHEHDPAFAPEPFTALYQRSLYQSFRSQTAQTLQLLRRQLPALPDEARLPARTVLESERELLARFRTVVDRRVGSARIRNHGDYHLGQVLYTGNDFMIIDFEGEPSRPITERRTKRSAMRDVAGMVRSFHYAAHTALRNQESGGFIRPERRDAMEPWARFWFQWVAATFIRSYRETARGTVFLPRDPDEAHTLLDVYLLEKAMYELQYELNNRPDWVRTPLHGIIQLLGDVE